MSNVKSAAIIVEKGYVKNGKVIRLEISMRLDINVVYGCNKNGSC